ncbi:FecCD family ABC transporter permease [Klebsiella quasipneumoniae subsp. similipneumoniae]|uniref:FecCD family ABC transporter permease n=1 Tax=Klebsiella quasipneumoniae TaxID=1463165 RepID=UPI0038CFFC5F
MTRAVHRAGFRPLLFASRQLLLRPAALKIAAFMLLMLLALGLYSLSRGSYPLPASTLAQALLAPQEMGEQPRFILFDIRLPRILMALLCGALLVLTLARDCSRPRFILIGIGVSWTLAAAVGIFMTTADVRDVQTAMIWLAGSLQAATWPLLAVAFCWALPGAIILFCTARAADAALLGDRTAIGLGVRLQQLTLLRFFAPVLLTSASVSCVGSLGFVGLMAPHMARFVLRGGQVSLLSGSALIGALLVLATDTLGRLAFAPLQIPAGIVIALVGCPFFVVLLWRRRDAL